MDGKKKLFSGIQPSGLLTIGNYIGALKNWVSLQEEYDCVYSIADLHAVTVRQEPAELRRNTMELAATLLACGIDGEKSVLFVQSHVPAHAELTWLLNCVTYVGEMTRMIQFKEKSKKNGGNVNMGLMDYPVLQAADILLYRAELVPVGADQKQHLEIARDIAERFNARYGETFTPPEAYIPKKGARVMSLGNPLEKMSKSDPNPNAFVSLLDDTDTIIRKFKRAVTDSGGEIAARPDKPGIANLLTIYSAFSGKTVKEAEREFEGRGYGDFKAAVGETVAGVLKPVQAKQKEYFADKGYLAAVLAAGREKAAAIANRTLGKAYKKTGFYI